MKWPLLTLLKSGTEEEYIDGLRRGVAAVDRWRPVMILLGVAMILLLAMAMCVFWPPPLLKPVNIELRIWIPMLMSMGFTMGNGIHSIMQCLTINSSGVRTERLLLKYYDAHNSEQKIDTKDR